ncbi:MAG: ABC transporter permease [Armatimonadota bacterium]|nr:ABC transporter permease [Armatimonadota bacterium]MDR7545299.1 ABC transporter permease [Armatimonadota bacterium]MDR7612118.1 ABC transporter permease [Armatimonadota bacterium]
MAVPQWVAPRDPLALAMGDRLHPPSARYWFGTDEGGRDLFSRIVYGARYSVGMALVVVLAAAGVGSVYGVVAGYAGGTVDMVMMRVVDIFLAFPYLILAMAIASALGRGAFSAVAALAVVWWPSFARMVRGQVLSVREHQYVEAARALGASDRVILFRHVLPQCLPAVGARITLDLGYAILALTGLSFLGLGVQNPTPEWGLMVATSRMFVFRAWWYAVMPGVAIFLTVLALTFAGQALSPNPAHPRPRPWTTLFRRS